MEKLLIIDDDITLANSLKDALVEHGWLVELVGNGTDALQLLANFQYDFILLDWHLPSLSGIEVCRRFRANGGHTPIIFLTGRREVADKEAGLDAGGDDYLTKPFEVRELLARIRSIQRRPRGFVTEKLLLRGLRLDPKLRSAKFRDSSVQLSPTESNILEFLFRNRNSFFTASQIFSAIWPSDSGASEETVRVHIKFLRSKLARIGADSLLESVKAHGYIVRDDGDV